MLAERIRVARGEQLADLVLRNARLVNVFSGDVHTVDVAVHQGRVMGLGSYQGREEIDLEERYVCPGLIDGHVHIESAMVHPAEFARAVVPHGTTTVIADPHEIANVMGVAGVRYLLEATADLPLNVYLMAPSCVPASPLETAGAELGVAEIRELLSEPRVLGLGELMNFPGVVRGLPQLLEKIQAARGCPVDGHAPGLTGRDLCAYVAAGIGSDHECIDLQEALEKLRLGMTIMIRQGSSAQNLEALLPLVMPGNASNCFFVSDDRHPADLINQGHMDAILRQAQPQELLPPVTLVQLATLNAARYFRLWDLGGIAPGYRADMVVVDDIEDFQASMVFKDGQLVARDGQMLGRMMPEQRPAPASSFQVADFGLERLAIPAAGERLRLIGVVPGQIVTQALVEAAKIEDGLAVADPERDLLKIAVVERHRGSGNVGLGFVRGFGLKRGAIASSVAHDSHNIVVVGASDIEMARAVQAVIRLQGGQVVVAGEEILAALPLPIAGLMSERPLEQVSTAVEALNRAAQSLGCSLDAPLMTMAFMALVVIPELKLSDRGLVDVNAFEIVPLFV
ncbi:MAG: adenine deaminase [Chloroflexia bacterium]|nr:adenine deaminase [Chloroflexia bacterium]